MLFRSLSQKFDEKRMSPSYIYMHNKRMMEYYSCVGDYKKAYGYLELVNIYDDSIRNITRINNISEIESRYSQDTIILHKDVIIANSKAELSKMTTKTAIITSIMVVITLVFIFVVFFNIKRNQLYNARQTSAINKLRMENVRNRISPHFVFNVLNCIMPAVKKYDNISEPIEQMISVIRGNLMNSDRLTVSLEEELNRPEKRRVGKGGLRRCILRGLPNT